MNMPYYSVHSTNPTEKNLLSIGRPTPIERRRATRHHFVSAVEVINVESRKQLISLTRDSLAICGEAENGKQAFEKVREPKLDLVILNVSMPVMNGVEAAREIRRCAPRSKIDGLASPTISGTLCNCLYA